MAVGSQTGDYGFTGGTERDSYSGDRRARIRERFAFHKNLSSGANGLRKSTRVIDLEPIAAEQIESAAAEVDLQKSKLHRGNIINIQI